MNVESFKHLAKTFSAIPVYRQLLADTLTPVSLFLNIREGSDHPFLFESVEGGDQMARYSFLGCNPYEILQFDGKKTELRDKDGTVTVFESYFEALKTCTTKYTEPRLPGLPRLTGGAVGFSSYDTFRQVEYLPNTPHDDLGLPEAVWGL
jgi:anthranilate synthase component I